MIRWFSKFLDHTSEFLASRKGLLPLIGILLIIVNFILVSALPLDSLITQPIAEPALQAIALYLVQTNLFLHLGLIIALIGQMLAWAL